MIVLGHTARVKNLPQRLSLYSSHYPWDTWTQCDYYLADSYCNTIHPLGASHINKQDEGLPDYSGPSPPRTWGQCKWKDRSFESNLTLHYISTCASKDEAVLPHYRNTILIPKKINSDSIRLIVSAHVLITSVYSISFIVVFSKFVPVSVYVLHFIVVFSLLI